MGSMRLPLASALVAVGLALPAAGETLSCSFESPCFGTNPCGPASAVPATLTRSGEGWDLVLAGRPYPVTPLEESDLGLHLVATGIDPMAGAVGLISVYGDGTAFLTVTGSFLTPTSGTDRGTCRIEEH